VHRFCLAAVVLAGSLASCGRIDFTPRAPSDGGGSADATPQLRCDPATPFGTPTPITELNVAGSYDSTLTLTRDELTAYWYSDRGNASGVYDLWTASRGDVGSPFTNITPMSALDSPQTDKEPGVAPDGSVLAFISMRAPADATGDIFVSLPIGSAPVQIANLSSGHAEYHPFFQIDASDFWFASNRAGTFSIYHSTYLGAGTFAAPTQVTDLDASGANTDDAVVGAGGLVAYIRSDRAGGPGGEDIWRAERATTSDTWNAPVVETEVDSPDLDTPSWISPDLCRLYMSSARTDTSDLYVATRVP